MTSSLVQVCFANGAIIEVQENTNPVALQLAISVQWMRPAIDIEQVLLYSKPVDFRKAVGDLSLIGEKVLDQNPFFSTRLEHQPMIATR